MNKGIGALIIGILAVLGGAFVATVLLRKKLAHKDEEVDFDSFETPVDDEEFEHFFGDDDESDAPVDDDADETDEDEESEEQL